MSLDGAPFPPGMEDPFPLKGAKVVLIDRPASRGAAITGTPVEVRADSRGRFSFDAAALGGRELSSLALQVVAYYPGHVRACYEGYDTPWAFFAHGGDHADHIEELGPEMAVYVPEESTRPAHLWSRALGDDDAPSLSGSGSDYPVYRGFYAFAFVIQMRSWLWGRRGSPAAFQVGSGVNLMYPANSSWYSPAGQTVYLDSAQRGTSREEFKDSWIAHEFGHHVFCATAPRAARVGGGHQWYEAESRRTTQRALRSGLARDFSEGFATFIGQQFLGTDRYQDERGGSRSIESEGTGGSGETHCRFGDYASAAYFWDLADDAADGETAALGFAGVMNAFSRFAAARGPAYLVVPDFHDFLISSGILTASVANAVLDHNDLRSVHDDWQRIPDAIRNGQPGS